jgi:hypothetical protein
MPEWFYGYGVWCAKESYRLGLDIVQWADTPHSGDAIDPTQEGFAQLALCADFWLRGWHAAKETGLDDFKTKPGTVPLFHGIRPSDDVGWGPKCRRAIRPTWHTYQQAGAVLLLRTPWDGVGGSWRAVPSWKGDWLICMPTPDLLRMLGGRGSPTDDDRRSTWLETLPLSDPHFLGITGLDPVAQYA